MHKNGVLVFFIAAIFICSACGDDDDSSTDTGDAGNADDAISDVTVEVHESVNTMLVVTWSQDVETEEVWLRYTFENDEWYESPTMPGDTGEHEELILGIPQNTEVTFHVVSKSGDVEIESDGFQGTTGSIPTEIPSVDVEMFNASKASPDKWMLGVVCAGEHYTGPFWILIIDRQGRIVWYHADIANNPMIAFPRISRDGRYIFFGNRTPFTDDSIGFVPSIVKMTLDSEYFERIEVPVSDNVDMTDDGSLLFNSLIYGGMESWLIEYLPDGTLRYIWDCVDYFGETEVECYSNTINWSPLTDTILMSFIAFDTVLEIDRQTGDVVGQYGQLPGSYAFDPDTWGFEFQHYPNITPEGTLMVSSHIPGLPKHAFMEFEIDRENETLIEKWIYREGDEWADAMGEAHRIPNGNGNVLANYGSGGIIKEITPDFQVVWKVYVYHFGSGYLQPKMVGHCTLLDDLYALNRGPE